MWVPRVRLDPEDGVPDGVVVYLVDTEDGVLRPGGGEDPKDGEEVGAVLFGRGASEHPEEPFAQRLAVVIARADAAAEAINDLEEELERLRADAVREHRERLRSVLAELDQPRPEGRENREEEAPEMSDKT